MLVFLLCLSWIFDWSERTGNPLTGFLCFGPSLLFQHILKHQGQRWLEVGFYRLIPEIFESMSLTWTPEIYMLPSSQVVLIELILEPTPKTLLWNPNSAGNQWIIITIIIKWEHLKWSLLRSHPWIFWSKCSEEEDGIILSDLKNWMEKHNRCSGLFTQGSHSCGVSQRGIRSVLCACCLWPCSSLAQCSQFLVEPVHLKAPRWDLVFLSFPSSNHWSLCKHKHKNILQTVPKSENAALSHVKTMRTELSFLISWGIIHEVPIWSLRKVSKEMLLLTWVMCVVLSALEGYPSISQEPLGSALIYCVIVVPSSSAQIPAEPETCHWVGVRVEHFLREDCTWSNIAGFSF